MVHELNPCLRTQGWVGFSSVIATPSRTNIHPFLHPNLDAFFNLCLSVGEVTSLCVSVYVCVSVCLRVCLLCVCVFGRDPKRLRLYLPEVMFHRSQANWVLVWPLPPPATLRGRQLEEAVTPDTASD